MVIVSNFPLNWHLSTYGLVEWMVANNTTQSSKVPKKCPATNRTSIPHPYPKAQEPQWKTTWNILRARGGEHQNKTVSSGHERTLDSGAQNSYGCLQKTKPVVLDGEGGGLCAPFLARRAMTSSQALGEEESIFFKGLASSRLIPHVRIGGLLDFLFFFWKKGHEVGYEEAEVDL